MSLEGDLKAYSSQLPINPARGEKQFSTFLHTQRELAMIIADEANIKAKLIQIQSAITPHIKVLQKEQAYVENVL